MKRCIRPRRAGRPSFTLVEILVVIALLAVLVALTAGTIMQVLASRTKTNTEQEVRTIFEALDSHQRAVIDQANELVIPQAVMQLGGDDKRAKVIWRKLQLKRHFPMTFAEALSPATVTGNTPLPYMPGGGGVIDQLRQDPGMQPLTVFTKNLVPILAAPLGTGTYPAGSNPQAEMGVLLRLTLTVNRRGTKPFIAEEVLGPQAVADSTGGVIGLPQIVDGWGNSLAFFRFPTDNLDMDSSKPGNPTTDIRRDPQDPEGTLINPKWNFNNSSGVTLFELLLHRIHDASLPQWAVATYMQPTIVSAGPNKRLGILLAPTVLPAYTAWPYVPPYFSASPQVTGSPNFGMYPDMITDPKNNPPTGPPNSYNDDIFSFTLH
jgi:type II secretory pathway pseudopilin PulG